MKIGRFVPRLYKYDADTVVFPATRCSSVRSAIWIVGRCKSGLRTFRSGFVPGAVGTRPLFTAVRSDFWAQGINVGFELKY